MDIIKQAVGIDISKDDFVVRFGSITKSQETNISKDETFRNDSKGFKKFDKWLEKNKVDDNTPLWIVMEATGVYYENLAYYLSDQGFNLCVLLPNKAKNYARTLENKSKTDSIDSKVLTQLGLERKLVHWEIPNPLYRELKSLTRERTSLLSMSLQLKNQLHAKKHSFSPGKTTVKRINSLLKKYKNLIKAVEEEIESLLQSDNDLAAKVKKIKTIKGVGLITIASILAETNGFALIKNRKQLASYAGLDVVLNESGKRRGKTRISKKGNSNLRHSVYMPALTAVRYNVEFKNLYVRIIEQKSIKKIGLIAVARKILLLVYTLWKNNKEYIYNYQMA